MPAGTSQLGGVKRPPLARIKATCVPSALKDSVVDVFPG